MGNMFVTPRKTEYFVNTPDQKYIPVSARIPEGLSFPPQRNPPVTAFHDSEEWRDHFEGSRNTNELMVVDFTAGREPCQMMEPIFKELAERYTDIEFIRIDVDELNDVAGEFGIETLPTFVFMRSGKELERVVGAIHGDKLEELIEKYKD